VDTLVPFVMVPTISITMVMDVADFFQGMDILAVIFAIIPVFGDGDYHVSNNLVVH
jgi:hypothetical protein